MAANKIVKALCALACALILGRGASTASAAPIPLADSTFDEMLDSTNSLLVLFKANKCPHCTRVAPHYEQISDDDDIGQFGVTVASIDVPSNRGSALRFGIRGFPTLIYFHNGRMYRYRGKRTFNPMKSFVLKGYENQGEGEEIPPKPTFLGHFALIGNAVYVELHDAAMGKSGAAGYAMVVLLSVLVGLLGFTVLFIIVMLTKGPEDDKVKTQ